MGQSWRGSGQRRPVPRPTAARHPGTLFLLLVPQAECPSPPRHSTSPECQGPRPPWSPRDGQHPPKSKHMIQHLSLPLPILPHSMLLRPCEAGTGEEMVQSPASDPAGAEPGPGGRNWATASPTCGPLSNEQWGTEDVPLPRRVARAPPPPSPVTCHPAGLVSIPPAITGLALW